MKTVCALATGALGLLLSSCAATPDGPQLKADSARPGPTAPFQNLDDDAVLASLGRLSIGHHVVRSSDGVTRHLGPTPQDFYAAFGLGDGPLAIDPRDADGVTLRAIQALEARTRAQHRRMLEDTQSLANESGSLVLENADRIADIAALKAEVAAVRAELSALRRSMRR